MSILSSSVQIGDVILQNRIVMASLTRNRPLSSPLVQKYYEQRASAGLIISEGTLISPQGTEWPYAPGIYNKKQITQWKSIIDAVHAGGAKIACQLWHLGRVCHPLHQCGQPNVGPSALAAKGGNFRLLAGSPAYQVPEAIEDPKEYVDLYKNAAINCKEAGFDMIELHAANGYLPNQFLDSTSNQRTDAYGGSPENRCRFVLEIIDEMIAVYGAKRVGIKINPGGGYNDMGMPLEEAMATYTHLVSELERRQIAYIQYGRWIPAFDPANRGLFISEAPFRAIFKSGALILNGDIDGKAAEELLQKGECEAVAFGRAYINNPDLATRLIKGQPVSQNTNYAFWFVGNTENPEVGYTDYPTYEEEQAKSA